jgi:drug/metabolite transporter (DMT)-like permease
MNTAGAIAFAMIAAIGNALFVTAQKKAGLFDNGISFIACSLAVALALLILTAPLFGPPQYPSIIKQGGGWIAFSGLGLFLVYLGFNLLYTRYGASHYILYAVLSIMTTSLVVGVLLYKETFNIYHWASLVCALATVILFSLGDAKT